MKWRFVFVWGWVQQLSQVCLKRLGGKKSFPSFFSLVLEDLCGQKFVHRIHTVEGGERGRKLTAEALHLTRSCGRGWCLLEPLLS